MRGASRRGGYDVFRVVNGVGIRRGASCELAQRLNPKLATVRHKDSGKKAVVAQRGRDDTARRSLNVPAIRLGRLRLGKSERTIGVLNLDPVGTGPDRMFCKTERAASSVDRHVDGKRTVVSAVEGQSGHVAGVKA